MLTCKGFTSFWNYEWLLWLFIELLIIGVPFGNPSEGIASRQKYFRREGLPNRIFHKKHIGREGPPDRIFHKKQVGREGPVSCESERFAIDA